MEDTNSEKINLTFLQVYLHLIKLPIDEVKKIPKKFWDLLDENIPQNIDMDSKLIQEDNMTEDAKSILSAIYIDFLTTGEEKEKLKSIEKRRLQEIEEEKYEKYNPENIFKKQEIVKTEIIEDENLPVLVKENFFTKIINKIKNLFNVKR